MPTSFTRSRRSPPRSSSRRSHARRRVEAGSMAHGAQPARPVHQHHPRSQARDKRTRRLLSSCVSTHLSLTFSSRGKIRPRKAPNPTSRPPSEVAFDRCLFARTHSPRDSLSLTPKAVFWLISLARAPHRARPAHATRQTPRISNTARPCCDTAASRRETADGPNPIGLKPRSRRAKSGFESGSGSVSTVTTDPRPWLSCCVLTRPHRSAHVPHNVRSRGREQAGAWDRRGRPGAA